MDETGAQEKQSHEADSREQSDSEIRREESRTQVSESRGQYERCKKATQREQEVEIVKARTKNPTAASLPPVAESSPAPMAQFNPDQNNPIGRPPI